MSDLFLPSLSQMSKIEPFFPKSHGVPRVDDRRVVSGIVYVLKHGLQWRNSPGTYCKIQYKQRHKVENMFSKLKDWKRIATRYDRRADVFMAAITISAIFIWWL